MGALLCEPHDPTCAAGVIFFNNAGYLGMCGHGTIGLAVTLSHMGRIKPGRHRFETPVGVVGVELADRRTATVENVESYRHRTAVSVEVAGIGPVVGDVAWGGNWFFLIDEPRRPDPGQRRQPDRTWRLTAKRVLASPGHHRRRRRANRPHRAVRSAESGRRTAGTSCSVPARRTTARRAAPAPAPSWPACTPTASCARGGVAAGKHHRQRFRATFEPGPNGGIMPRISGRAFVCAESTLLQDPLDPFGYGFSGITPA